MKRLNIQYLFFVIIILFLPFSCKKAVTTVTQPTKQESQISIPSISLLETYVKAKDDAFEYKLVDEIKEKGYTTYIIRMVSQKWLTTKEVKDPIWWHWLTVVVPDGVTSNTAMLMISGGSRKTAQPKAAEESTLQCALASQSIVATLHNVPNQTTEFVGDDFGPRVEDELIAYGWREFMERGAKDEDAIWLARFPMTKAAVRAMDVVSEFVQKNTTAKVDKFVVAGASKRGWATWTTAAVDDRVVAIIPVVIDMLNMDPSFMHHWRVYGAWAPAVGDYVHEGVMEWQGSKEYNRILELTEPYAFREKLTMPKLLLNATGDQFFIPDSWRFYWNDLKGEKHLRYVPNSEHSMRGTDVFESLLAFYQMILADKERPDFDWKVEKGTIHIQTKTTNPPSTVTLWQAHNPAGRSFQVDAIGRTYQSKDIPVAADGKYMISIPSPDKGYAAFYVELTFPGIGTIPLKMSTGIVVTPDTYPFEAFKSVKPMGTRE